MIRKKVLIQQRTIFGLLFSCFIVSSCAVPPAPLAAAFPSNLYIDSQIDNSRVSDFQINEALDSTGLLNVEATFRNQRGSQFVFVYRFIWFDNNNFTIKTRLSNWKSLIVQPRSSAALRGIAPAERATKYRLEIYSKDTIFENDAEVDPDK